MKHPANDRNRFLAAAAILIISIPAFAEFAVANDGEGESGDRVPSAIGETQASAPPPPSGTLSLNDCYGFIGSMVWPGHTSPARVPPGWEDPPGTAASENLYAIFLCERVNLGPLERGPVSYVWEWTNGIRAPDACAFDGFKPTWYTVNFMVDDAEVADYMEQEMGMTILRGTIDITTQKQNGIGTSEAIWHIDGAPGPSRIQQVHHGIVTGVANEHYRIYWDNDQGITVSHWDHSARIDMTRAPTEISQFQPPWTHSQFANGHGGEFLRPTQMSSAIGEYTEFGDFECSKPRQR